MRTIIGVMGGGKVDQATLKTARRLGALIAEEGWVLLNGGRNCGVMAASAAGAREVGGLTVGVLPDEDTRQATPDIDIPIPTGLGDARNVVNVLASRVVIACRGGAGTISEIAHALKLGRPVVALDFALGEAFARFYATGRLVDAATPEEAIAHAKRFLGQERSL
ncbi:MAG: TIGR00725 family protein [Coriobacteriia bacterium]|nr:TIGR00725 family protein [Coriobacteriia bacterium]